MTNVVDLSFSKEIDTFVERTRAYKLEPWSFVTKKRNCLFVGIFSTVNNKLQKIAAEIKAQKM